MASKLRQGRDIEIPGVNAAQSLQDAIRDVLALREKRIVVRPEGAFTVKEYAESLGISESTAKVVHLYPLVKDGSLEVIKSLRPRGGGIVNFYRKKISEIESSRKEAQPASNKHALATGRGRK